MSQRPDPTHGVFASKVPLRDLVDCVGETCTAVYSGALPQSIRREVWDRDGHACVYCDVQFSVHPGPHQRTIDHVVAKAIGGCDHSSNLVSACRSCNCRKGTRSAEEFASHIVRGAA